MPREKHQEKEKYQEKDKHHKEKKEKPKEKRMETDDEERKVLQDTISFNKMEEDNSLTLSELIREQREEPALKHTKKESPSKEIRFEPDVEKMITEVPVQKPGWKLFVSNDFDTQFPFAPASVIIAYDVIHARQLLDVNLKAKGLKTSIEHPYELYEISPNDPCALILSMGQMQGQKTDRLLDI